MPSKKPTILIRTDNETKEMLEKLAKADNRSLSNYIDILLRNHVQQKQSNNMQTVNNSGIMKIGIQNNQIGDKSK